MRINEEFWKKLTEDQQATLLAGTVGAIIFLLWIISIFLGVPLV